MTQPHPASAATESDITTLVVIDDVRSGSMLVAGILKSIAPNIEVVEFADPREAIDFILTHEVSLVVTDYKMPIMDGVEVIRILRRSFTFQELPIVVATAVNDREMRYRAFEAGTTDIVTRPIDPLECKVRCANLINLHDQYKLNRSHMKLLEGSLSTARGEARRQEVETLAALGQLLEPKQTAKARRARVASIAQWLASQSSEASGQADLISAAATIYHMGAISATPARAESQSFVDVLSASPSEYLQVAASVSLAIQERFDGTGTPCGLKGKNIPVAARIIAVAEAFVQNAGTNALADGAVQRAAAAIKEESGTALDPDLVHIVCANIAAIPLDGAKK